MYHILRKRRIATRRIHGCKLDIRFGRMDANLIPHRLHDPVDGMLRATISGQVSRAENSSEGTTPKKILVIPLEKFPYKN